MRGGSPGCLAAYAVGAKVTAVGPTVVVEGDIDDAAQMTRVLSVLETIGNAKPGAISVVNLVRMSQRAKEVLAERIEKDIGSPEMTVRFINESLVLEGVAENDFAADRAVEMTKVYLASGEGVARKPATAEGEGKMVAPAFSPTVWGNVTILDLFRVRPSVRKLSEVRKRPRPFAGPFPPVESLAH